MVPLSGIDPFPVGPSKHQDAWLDFLGADTYDEARFEELVGSESIGVALFQIEAAIDGLHQHAEMRNERAAEGWLLNNRDPVGLARWLSEHAEPHRVRLGPRQTELDLGMMRWMRRASCLGLVLGAGVTMNADPAGPSWPALVRRLLSLVLTRGREHYKVVERPGSTPERRTFENIVERVEHLAAEQRGRAEEVVRALNGTPSGAHRHAMQADADVSLRGNARARHTHQPIDARQRPDVHEHHVAA
jgi:hypothetical protein